MFRLFFVTLMVFAILGIVVPEVPVFQEVIGIEEANAATKKKRKSLFDILFKRKKRTSKKKKIRPTISLKKKKRNIVPRTGTQTASPKLAVVKSENASNILVIGDFIATGMARGLKKLYTSNPNVVVVAKTNASSGMVRNDVIDWPKSVPALIEEFRPIAVVALVGMNDRQQMRLSTGGRAQKLSEEWLTAYNQRAEALSKSVTERNIPFVWVGLPPVRSNAMNADYLVFNEVYRNKTESQNGVYVDVWDGFTNAEGKFVSAGPDIKGQIVRLRGSKGINMTRAGKDKLAFYADKALRKLGVLTSPREFLLSSFSDFGSGVVQPVRPEYDPVKTGKTIIIPLGAPAVDGGNVLEGETGFLQASDSEKSSSYQLVEEGLGYQPQTGRIDAAWGASSVKPIEPAKKAADVKPEKTSSLIIIEENIAN